MSATSQRLDAIVTQGYGRIAYNVVRSLGRQGLRVGLGVDNFSGMAVASKYVQSVFRHPFYVSQTAAFLETVKAVLLEFSPKVYLPSESESLVIAQNRDIFKDVSAAIPIAPYRTLKALHRKDEVTRLAASLDIPTPATIAPKDENDILAFAREYGTPVVIKPVASSGARGIRYLNMEDLRSLGNGNSSWTAIRPGRYIVQQYVRGVGYGVSMLFNRGKLRAQFAHKRIREQRSTGGISTLRIGVKNALLEEYACRLLSSVEYHGVAMVEFKYDEETGKGWLIEVNPRFWGSLALAVQSGVDFPYLLYKMAADGDVTPVADYQAGVRVKWVLGDVHSLLRRSFHLGSLTSRDNLLGADGYDDLYGDDILPFFAQIYFALRKSYKKRQWVLAQDDLPAEVL